MVRIWLAATLILASIITGPAASAQTVISNSTSHPQLATGDLRGYSYTSGATSSWDSDSDWAQGSYVGTSTAAGSGAVTLTGAASNWWNSAWRNRRCFSVTNPASYALAAHPVLLQYNSSTDLSGGLLASGAADLRATTGGPSPTTLPFDLVGPWPSPSSGVWVKVPALAAGASTSVCLYFTNPAASALPANPSARYDPLYRVRGGSSTTIADPAGNWLTDAPAPTGVSVNTGNGFASGLVLPLDASVPAGTPAALFDSERWDDTPNPELRYRFTVATGRPVRVRLLVAEIYFTASGLRVFNVNVEGGPQEITNLDAFAVCQARGLPGRCGLAYDYAFPSSTDGFIDVDFIHVIQNPKVAAIEILDETVLGFTGGALESMAATNGTWTSPVMDTGAAGVYGLTSATATVPAGTTWSYRIATASAVAGPWTYLGPDGTFGTSYSGAPQPLGYAADGQRYFRVQATFTGTGVSPTMSQLQVGHSLSLLPRSSGSRALVTASAGTGLKWAVRLRSSEATVWASTAQLLVDATSLWGSASLTGSFDSPAVSCCGSTQFSVAAGVLSSSASNVPVFGGGGLSIALTRSNTAAATADLTARFALANTARVELPVRIVLP